MAKKKNNLFTKIMACVGGIAVVAGAVFSILWFVPSIHDKIWTPNDQQQTEQETTTNKDATETTSK